MLTNLQHHKVIFLGKSVRLFKLYYMNLDYHHLSATIQKTELRKYSFTACEV